MKNYFLLAVGLLFGAMPLYAIADATDSAPPAVGAMVSPSSASGGRVIGGTAGLFDGAVATSGFTITWPYLRRNGSVVCRLPTGNPHATELQCFHGNASCVFSGHKTVYTVRQTGIQVTRARLYSSGPFITTCNHTHVSYHSYTK